MVELNRQDGAGPFARPHRDGATPARCRLKDCAQKATHYPGMILWARGRVHEHPPLRVVVELPLCRDHATNPDVWCDKRVQDMVWLSLKRKGMAPPDFKQARFFATSIKNGDHPYTKRPTE